jgi:Fe-S cluster biosynthesis and repair protein YggX
MADTAAEKEEKEKRRKKQAKRMGKVLARAWQLDDSEDFQDDSGSGGSTAVLCLTAIGKKIDAEGEYRLGRHGWEDFARDLGGVYNRHIQRYAALIDFISFGHFVQPCVEPVLKTCWRQYISKNTILHVINAMYMCVMDTDTRSMMWS